MVKNRLPVALLIRWALLLCSQLLCSQAPGQGPLPPPAPRSYAECDQFNLAGQSASLQLLNQAQACDLRVGNQAGCFQAFNNHCTQAGCGHTGAAPSPCGNVNYSCNACANLYYENACLRQKIGAQTSQCYAQVQAYLARQQASGQGAQSNSNQSISGSISNVGTILSAGTQAQPSSAGSSSGFSNTDVVNAYSPASAINFKGIAETWSEERIPELSHAFDAWKIADFANAVSQLQSGNQSEQVQGIGGVAKGLLDVHWGVYALNPLSAATSQVMIDVITNLYGEAFLNLDKGMAAALSEITPPPSSDSAGNFYRTLAPTSVAYVRENPAPTADLSSVNSQYQEDDVNADQFSQALSSGQSTGDSGAAPAKPSIDEPCYSHGKLIYPPFPPGTTCW